MGGELLSFDEALAELQMATHELRSLVAQGEIRAFRDEDILKFRRTDILDLKKTRETQTGGVILEPDELPQVPDASAPAPPGKEVKAAKHETEETELLAGIGPEAPVDFLGLDDTAVTEGSDTAQTVVPTIEISDEDVDDTAQTIIPQPMGFGKESDTELPAAPLLLKDEDEGTDVTVEEIDDASQTVASERPLGFRDRQHYGAVAAEEEEDAEPATVGASSTAAPVGSRIAALRAEVAEPPISKVFVALVVATFVVLLLSVPVIYGLGSDTAPDFGPYGMLFDKLK